MALQVWLPLNGDLTQQGLSNITVTNNGATVDNNGKIGKCYNLTNGPITISNLQQSKAISIAFWFKRTVNTGTRQFMFTAWNGVTCELTTSGAPTFAVYKSSYPTITGANITDTTTWYHYCGTFSETDGMKLYINGKLIASDNNKNPIQWNTTSGQIGKYASYASMSALMNDFRIYDHALSAKEVKELAKGLVLHYRLAGPGQENLFKNTSPVETKSNNEWIQLGNDTTAIFDTNGLITYTLSFDAKSEIAGSFDLYSTSGSNPKYTWPHKNINLTTNWQHFSHSFIPVLSNPSGTWSRASIYGIYSTGKIPSIKNVKLERGSVQTPWCPNPADSLYSTLGYNNNIEYDCSGYRRNGTKSGTITWDVNSPRYTTSYKFVAGTSKIKLPAFNMSGFANSYTFSWWQYNIGSNNMPWGFSDGNRLNPYHTGNLCWNTGDGGSNPFVPNITSSTLYNAWHHIVITGNGTDTKLYIDGEYKGKATTYKSLTGTQIYLSGWDTGTSYTMTGSREADFRIYATALSAEDIAELYHSAVIVDNTGKNYAYEYFEA